MTAHKRMLVIAALILLSAVYSLLVKKDQEIAETIAVGYVAILLTGMLLINVWKKP